jgi:hypothetical protein
MGMIVLALPAAATATTFLKLCCGIMRRMNRKTILLLAAGAGFFAVSHALELRGDAAPFAASGVSGERATYHLAALAVLLASFGCFVTAAIGLFRKWVR